VLPILHGRSDEGSPEFSRIKNPLLLRKFIEILLHAAVLLGSSQIVQQREKNGSFVSNISIRTPAMRNLGLFLRPNVNLPNQQSRNNAAQNNGGWQMAAIRSRLLLYSKLFALVTATVIGPRFYEELKQWRQQQLRDRDRRQRSVDMHILSRPLENNNRHLSSREREQVMIDLRANDRKSLLQTIISDFIIGTVDVFMPPLRLINYISYLWGITSTPDLGMQLVGWNYATLADSSSDGLATSFGQQYHRHANFHYGNRRLLVEEALRTVSSVIPPRESAIIPIARQTPSRNNIMNNNSLQDRQTETETSGESLRNINYRRRSWFRKRALSFMGVVEEKDKTSLQNKLNCVKCGTENPTVPYMTSCGHCYCYICLRMAVTDDIYFQCVECGEQIKTSSRIDFNETQVN
jgi:hypothetical protein